ncbi:MAG: hypothetical protein MUE73_14490 [Planctomycetes bacterium]|jgi:hypothetical protein|nr:hypothetical protein [Planctomycetota bacterium]
MNSGSSTDGRPLRLVVHDATRPVLGPVWWFGGRTARLLGRVDATFGAHSWSEALAWLSAVAAPRRIGAVQFWMHGRWGGVRIGAEELRAEWFSPRHPALPALATLRRRLAGPDALLWFRTCETFGARTGRAFAREASRFFGARVAGHTFVIHALQSGLHLLGPGEEPDWPENEGLARGTPEAPEKARTSWLFRPRTVTCLRMKIPS